METKKKYFMDCHLAGRKYYDAAEVWNQLQVAPHSASCAKPTTDTTPMPLPCATMTSAKRSSTTSATS